jgi:cytidine deaminase
LSDSEREDRWPATERRQTPERRSTDRRSGANRRKENLAQPPGERRSGTADRRAAERRTGRDRRNDADWQPVALELTLARDVDPEQVLVTAAIDARTRAHARYSNFQVGAALEAADGRVITGCNIENASYGLTLCAERVALVKALSDGVEVFIRMVVVTDTETPTPPCGPCRQLLWEYCGDIEIVLANLNRTISRYRLSALLPVPFDARLLE